MTGERRVEVEMGTGEENGTGMRISRSRLD